MLARLYWDADDFVNAAKHARRAVELDSQDPDPLLVLADLASRSGRLSETFDMLAKARLLMPHDVTLELKEGIERQRAGQLEAARDAYKKAVSLDPKSEAGHSNLAFVLFDLNEVDDALVHWNAALEINPGSADSLAGKAIALASKGETDAALEAYGTATLRDSRFFEPAKMQEDFFWSSTACKAAERLISHLRLGQAQRTAS